MYINLINANFEGLLLLQASANSIISGLIKYDQSIKASGLLGVSFGSVQI